MSNLYEVQAAQQRVAEAKTELRETIVKAIDGGVSISKIARTLGVTRRTIYNWLETLEHNPTHQPT